MKDCSYRIRSLLSYKLTIPICYHNTSITIHSSNLAVVIFTMRLFTRVIFCSYSEKFRNEPGMKWQLEININSMYEINIFLKRFHINFFEIISLYFEDIFNFTFNIPPIKINVSFMVSLISF